MLVHPELWMEFTHLCLHRWLLKQWGLWLLLFLSLSLSCCSLASLCSAASLSFWLALILASLCSSVSTAISLTVSDAYPLQPGLFLFFSLGCPSFPSLLLGCRSIFRSLSSTLGPVSHSSLSQSFFLLFCCLWSPTSSLSLSLLRRSLLALISADSEDILELESIFFYAQWNRHVAMKCCKSLN